MLTSGTSLVVMVLTTVLADNSYRLILLAFSIGDVNRRFADIVALEESLEHHLTTFNLG